MFGARPRQSETPAYPDDVIDIREAPADDATLAERLRNEPDPDPVVEEATQRLRDSLVQLEARDEWGRPVAWHLVARIALGAVLPEVSRLLGRLPGGGGELDLLQAARAEMAWERSAVPLPTPQRDDHGHSDVGWPA